MHSELKRLIRRFLRLYFRWGGLPIRFEPRTLRESLVVSADTRQLLLIGLSRTGTSLMQRLLNAYPTVFVSYESVYMPFLSRERWPEVHAYYYEIVKQHKHLCRAVSGSHGSAKPYTFEEPFDYFGDKVIYQDNARFRRQVRRAVGSADVHRILFLVRDPRARALSYGKWLRRRQRSYPRTAGGCLTAEAVQEAMVAQSCEWNRYIRDVTTHADANVKCEVVKYEDLLVYPERFMSDILDFLDLDRTQYPFDALDAVQTGSLDAWRTELNPEIQRRVSVVTQIHRERLGYAGGEGS